MGELILICTGDGDAMVCPVVNLAPREFFWSFFLWGGEKEGRSKGRPSGAAVSFRGYPSPTVSEATWA